MIEPHIDAIATLDTPQDAALLALNNAHAKETSFLSEDQWRSMIAGAFTAACVGGTSALLIAFDQDAQYANPNFEWFGERWSRFVYIDRVIVAEDHRGEGLVAEEDCGQGKLAPLLGNDKQRALDHTHHQSSESSVMHGGQPPMRIRITQRPVAARKKASTPH